MASNYDRHKLNHGCWIWMAVWLACVGCTLQLNDDANYFESIALKDIKDWASGFSRDIHHIARLTTCEDQLSKSFKDRGAEVKRRKTDETLKKIGSDINKLFNSRREIVTNLVKDAEREAAKYSLELASKRSQGVFGSGESASKTTEEEATTDEEEQESARETTESVVTSVATERNDSFTISEIDEVTTIESNGTVVTSVTSMTNTVDVLDANENIETDQSIIDQFDSLATTIAAGPRPNIATNEVPLPDESDVSIGSTTNNNIDFSDTDSDNEIGIGGSDTLEPEEMVASSVIDSSRDGTNAENRPISGHTSSDSMMTNAEDWLRRTVASDNELISKVFKAENAFLKRKSRSAKRSKRATTVSIENQTPADPTKEMDKESPDDSRTVDAEAGGDILASQLMPEMWSRNEEDEFVVFRDVKKIYEPWRTLSNYSIPRKIDETPDDPEEQLQYERWKTWAPVQTITDPIFPNYELNFSFSGLHVPLNVYPQHNNTRNAIKWSATLDHSFRRNRLVEPNLNFQFFCSIDGFLRIFPLIKWRVPNLFFTADKYRKLYSNSARPWRPPTAPGSGSNVGTTVDRAQRHAASDESVGRSGRKVRPNVPIDPHSIDSRSDGNQPQHELPEVAEEDWITDDDVDDNDPSRSLDLYDCRMRDWFIKAAAPAKDIIVLADSSGSMRGERSKITQNVIINILETLTENDFVSVLRFSANVFAVHPCFGTRFVQADKRNVARFKDEILEMSDDNRLEEAQKAANFTEAFSVAFRMFKEQSRSQHGSNCGKALMVITDGSQQNLDYVLSQIDDRDRSVRIFVYLIGREVTDTKSPETIACKNFGYFTHLKDLAEVKEEVQLYVPVLSRPIGLHARDATVVCSSVYADPLLPPLTDMVWEMHENRLFYEIYFRSNSAADSVPGAHLVRRHRSIDARTPIITSSPVSSSSSSSSSALSSQVVEPDLMVTLAMPVFNMTNGTKTSWDLLGVAGVDIPIRDILKEVPFYRLGVGGYMFIVNNNGFLIYHPDMRPAHKGFLKRFYTALDIIELELMDDGRSIKERNPELMAMRNSMVDETTDCAILRAKMHYDSMKRVTTRENHYCWVSINETLFTLGIALPNQYGHYYVKATLEMLPSKNYQKYLRLKDSRWFVHPNWHYCWDNLQHDQIRRRQWTRPLLMNMNPEQVIEHFMDVNLNSPERFAWVRYGQEPDNMNHTKVEFLCNKELMESFMFDARATKIEPRQSLRKLPKKLASKVQIQNVFLSTRSGLTRFFDFTNPSFSHHTKHRIQHRELTIDELIYKRTVEYSVKNQVEHFVFQIESEFDAFPASATSVTIARSFFLKGHPNESTTADDDSTASDHQIEHVPYMVSGMQITYNSFSELFFRHERNCDLVHCKIDCFRPDINCYLLDDNGYIVLSVNDFDSSRNLDNRLDKDAGRHLLELDYELFMHMTIGDQPIFRKVEVFDFQGICENPKEDTESSAVRLSCLFTWISSNAITLLSDLWLQAITRLSWSVTHAAAWSEYEDEEEITGIPNRTMVTACRKIYDLFELNNTDNFNRMPAQYSLIRKFDCKESYYMYKIENSNLIMLISQNECQKVRHKREPRYPSEVEDCTDPEYMHRKRPHMYEDHMCSPNQEEEKLKHCGARAAAVTLHVNLMYFIFIFVIHCLSPLERLPYLVQLSI